MSTQIKNRSINIEDKFCRVCNSREISLFNYDNYAFPSKDPNCWSTFYCLNCGAVSHYQYSGKKVSYDDGMYRNHGLENDSILQSNKVNPPVALPWSTISFKRWASIFTTLNRHTDIFKRGEIEYLDYGGYNGFLAYALKQKVKMNSTVADLDYDGLKMANYLGSKIIDLSKDDVEFNTYDLITVVHVLEHMESPETFVNDLTGMLNDEGVIYLEVPNLYGTPMADEAHLIYFSINSLAYLIKKTGMTIIGLGYCSTPIESVRYGYYYPSPKENIYLIATKSQQMKEIDYNWDSNPKNTQELVIKLTKSYSKIMLFHLSTVYLKQTFYFLKRLTVFITVGIVDYISLPFFKRPVSFGLLPILKTPLDAIRGLKKHEKS